MQVVGYMDGTSSDVLTTVILHGYETLPLSNGWDNHGKHLTLLNPADNLSIVVGPLHKFLRVSDKTIFKAMLASVESYGLMVFFIVPKEYHEQAEALIEAGELKYRLVDPGDLAKEVLDYLKK